MTTTRRSTIALGLVLCLLIMGGVRGSAQTGQSFGEIVGKATDEQGAVLPGVTVTLSGPAVMGTQTAVTNTSGIYRFPGVASGTYTLAFELAGFSKLTREGIVVPVRTTITVDAQMKLASIQETVTVTGESPVVDVENTKIGARLDHETLTSVPTSRSIFGTTTVLPGMVMGRQDPGGLNAATSTNMVAHGNRNYNLNYYGVTADTPANYGSMYYMDFGSAEEISVDTAAMGAEIGGGGGANINVIPKSGGNSFKGEALYSLTGKGLWDGFTASNITPELSAQGIRDPTLRELTDFNGNIGGPVVKDRLWWFASYRNYSTVEATPGYTIVNSNGSLTNPFDSNLRNYTGSGKYRINGGNQLSAFWTYNRKYQPHRAAGVAQPRPEGTINQQSPKHLFNGNWTSAMNQNTFLELSSSYFHMHWPSRFADEFYALPDAQKRSATFNISTGIYTDGPEPTGERIRDSYRFQTNIGLTRYLDNVLGAGHQVKLGYENWWGWGQDVFNVFNDTRLRLRNNAAGVPQPAEIFAYNTPLTQKSKMRNFAAFVQDRISYRRLTLNLGLRWSFYDGEIPEQEGGGGRWFPRVTYARVDVPYKWNTLAPRTGLVYQLTDDGKTVAKVAYSRYYEVMYTDEFSAINPNTIQTTGVATYAWFGDANGNGIVDAGEFNPTPLSVFTPRNNSIDPNLKDPRTDEVLVAFQRELMNNVSFSTSWVQRWYNDQTVNTNIGIPRDQYTARSFADAGPDNLVNTGDDRAVTFFDVNTAFLGRDAFFRTNFPGTQRYKGLEFTLTKRMSNRWQMIGSYVWSRLDGDRTLDPNDPNNLVDTMRTGSGADDQPHAFKLLGSYQAPWGVTVGANYQALTGLPRDRVLSVALRQGTTNLLVDNRGAYRADFLNLLSFRADKSFRLGRSNRASVVAELHNLLNSSAGQVGYGTLTRSFANQAAFDAARLTTSYFGRVQEIVAPRVFKLGFKFEF
jgi:hypothetical protein